MVLAKKIYILILINVLDDEQKWVHWSIQNFISFE